uniref:Secreted protein n=1 Tax=Arundo donax TaxID=35708 RepID=A0A0A9GXI7_ARUDO
MILVLSLAFLHLLGAHSRSNVAAQLICFDAKECSKPRFTRPCRRTRSLNLILVRKTECIYANY